jgi:beta-glucosidase
MNVVQKVYSIITISFVDGWRILGVHVLLGPTVNTQRSPLGGRGFESFSEDPHLNGTIAAAYIDGLQSKGISATVKHFVANDQEFQR